MPAACGGLVALQQPRALQRRAEVRVREDEIVVDTVARSRWRRRARRRRDRRAGRTVTSDATWASRTRRGRSCGARARGRRASRRRASAARAARPGAARSSPRWAASDGRRDRGPGLRCGELPTGPAPARPCTGLLNHKIAGVAHPPACRQTQYMPEYNHQPSQVDPPRLDAEDVAKILGIPRRRCTPRRRAGRVPHVVVGRPAALARPPEHHGRLRAPGS